MKKRGICTMGTVIRSEVSKKNQYYISKHRYYELKHFCLQYPEFKKIYESLCEKIPGGVIRVSSNSHLQDDESLDVRQRYLDKMDMIEKCALATDPVLGVYIFKAVTKGLTYSYFRMHDGVPCGRDMFYQMYRKFFYILDRQQKKFV